MIFEPLSCYFSILEYNIADFTNYRKRFFLGSHAEQIIIRTDIWAIFEKSPGQARLDPELKPVLTWSGKMQIPIFF